MQLLRDYLHQTNLPAQWNNVGCVVLTMIYVKTALEVAGWIRTKMGKRQESRILVHIASSSSIILWPLYDSEKLQSLNVLIPTAMAARMIYKVH